MKLAGHLPLDSLDPVHQLVQPIKNRLRYGFSCTHTDDRGNYHLT